MLSHVGNFAGKRAANSVKKSNGNLTSKVKKELLRALEADDPTLMEELSDFNVLLALDQSLTETEMEKLCELVKKFARGQKQGTAIDAKLKMKLKSVVGS
jgi:hypothetical protein